MPEAKTAAAESKPSEVCFIREETTYGPFFSSRKLARDYLMDACDMSEEEADISLAGRSPYVNVVGVVLDDPSVSFDG